jgi:hypothetical protein
MVASGAAVKADRIRKHKRDKDLGPRSADAAVQE